MNQLINPQEIEALSELLDKSDKIVLTCHVRPDGDAIGSTLGLYHLLHKLGKDVSVVVPDHPPRSLAFLPGFKQIAVFTKFDPYCTRLVNDADLIICCDFNTPSRQDLLAPLIQEAKCKKVMIDHHQYPDSFPDVTISYPDMSSTCELVFRVLCGLGLYGEIDKDSAQCLLAGIITDTRNFTVNTKHTDLYEILMRLMEKGAEKERIVKEALLTRSLSSLRLQAYAISSKMDIYEKHRAAVITLDRETLATFGYEKGDTEGLVNMPLEVRGIVSSFFLREDPEYIRISARSVGNYPVSTVCSEVFGGGGHLQAAGAEFKGSLEECKGLLVSSLPNYDKYLPSKLDKIE